MRHSFYIKMVYGAPEGMERAWCEEGEHYMHFAEDQQSSCDRFAESTSFLVYETGQQGGARAIFAQGTVLSLGCENVWAIDPVQDEAGHRYPLAVKVHVDKLVDPQNGITLDEIERICPRLENHFGRAMGGLIGITPEEFQLLSAALCAM